MYIVVNMKTREVMFRTNDWYKAVEVASKLNTDENYVYAIEIEEEVEGWERV